MPSPLRRARPCDRADGRATARCNRRGRSRSVGIARLTAPTSGITYPRGTERAATALQSTWGGGDPTERPTSIGCVPPTSSLAVLDHAQQPAWASGDSSANLVEQQRAARRPSQPPACGAIAPVNAPRSWPNSSDSARGAVYRRQLNRDYGRPHASGRYSVTRAHLLGGALSPSTALSSRVAASRSTSP